MQTRPLPELIHIVKHLAFVKPEYVAGKRRSALLPAHSTPRSGFGYKQPLRGAGFLESQAKAYLYVARRTDGIRNGAGGGLPDSDVRKVELRVIQNVEQFAAELKANPLRDDYLLEKREIDVDA